MGKIYDKAGAVQYRVERTYLSYVCCDQCKKTIETGYDVGKGKCSAEYFEVTTGHNDWGNDSCDSWKELYLCRDCMKDFVNKYLDSMQGSMEIEVKRHVASEYDYEDIRCKE